jgi:hypothetical protein
MFVRLSALNHLLVLYVQFILTAVNIPRLTLGSFFEIGMKELENNLMH